MRKFLIKTLFYGFSFIAAAAADWLQTDPAQKAKMRPFLNCSFVFKKNVGGVIIYDEAVRETFRDRFA